MKLVIPRDKWERGTGDGLLWNPKTDCGCVLGHYGLALGYTKEELGGCGTPSEVLVPFDDELPKWPSWVLAEYDGGEEEVLYRDSHFTTRVIEVNDEGHRPYREDDLRRLFANHGVELEFV